MRFLILLLGASLAFGCATKSGNEIEPEIITKVGVIKSKEDVEMEQVESDTRVNTSVHARISTGGRVSIGLGFLFFPFTSSSSDIEPVRYEVELIDGGQMTIYHDSRDFEVDDCVEITLHPDEEKHPPTMKHSRGGCA